MNLQVTPQLLFPTCIPHDFTGRQFSVLRNPHFTRGLKHHHSKAELQTVTISNVNITYDADFGKVKTAHSGMIFRYRSETD